MADLIVIEPEPANPGVAEYLEKLLARARDGEFSAIAVAYVYRDNTTGSGFSDQHSLPTMIGSVAGLQAKLIAEMQR